MQKNNRLWWLLTLTLLIPLLIIGCSTTGAPSAEPTAEPAEAVEPAEEEPAEEPADEEEAAEGESPYAGRTLTVVQSTGGGGDGVRPGIELWAETVGANVEITQLPYAELREKALLDFVSGTATYDVVQIDGAIWAAEMAPYLVPLDDLLESDPLPESEDFIPAVLRAMRVPYPDGTTYAIPVRYGTLIYHYRQDLLEATGLPAPATWDEYLAAAQAMTDGNIYGTTHAGKQGNFLVYNWFAFLYGFGSDFLNPDQTESVMGDRAVKATDFWADLYLEHKVVPPGMIAYEHDDVITAIQQEVAASAITYSPYALNFIDPENSLAAGKMAWGPIPYDDSVEGLAPGGVGSGWGLAINADSPNQDMAWDMIKFVSGPETQLKLALESANAPVRRSVFLNPEFQELFPAAEATLASLEGDKIRPGLTNWTAIEEVLAAELSAALVGDKSPEEAIQASNEQINSLLGQ